MKKISAAEFDRKFDAGEDISAYIDWKSARPFYKSPAKITSRPAALAKATKLVKKTRTPAKRAP